MQAFKDELKDWWHEDFKLQQLSKPKLEGKTGVSDRYSDEKMIHNKENKTYQKLTFNEQESKPVSGNQNFNVNLKGIRKQKLPSIPSKKVFSTVSNLQKTGSKKQVKIIDELDDKQCENDNNETQRPSTVKFPLRSGNHEFKIRSSGHFDSSTGKKNTR